jgi:hypothetical protein
MFPDSAPIKRPRRNQPSGPIAAFFPPGPGDRGHRRGHVVRSALFRFTRQKALGRMMERRAALPSATPTPTLLFALPMPVKTHRRLAKTRSITHGLW